MKATLSAPDGRLDATPLRRRTVLYCASFVFVLLLSLILRLDGFRDDLWVDELHTAWVVDGPWSELISRAAIGNQPPLYFAILKSITSVAKLSEISLRLLSLAAGMGLVSLGWDFARRVTDDWWCALLGAFAVGVDSTCIYYSSEARPYGLLQLVLAGLLCLVVHGGSGRVHVIVRALLAALAVHLQFTSLLFLAPLFAARLAVAWFGSTPDRWKNLLTLGIEVAVILILCAPLALQVLEIGSRSDAWATFVPRPSFDGFAELFPWVPAAVGLLVFAGRKLLSDAKPEPDPQWPYVRSALGWLMVSSLAPVVLALGVALCDFAPLFYRRYLLGSLWPLLMIPAVALTLNRGIIKGVLLLAFAAAIVWDGDLFAPGCCKAGRLTPSRGESWSAATRQIAEIDPGGKYPLFVASGFIESRRLKDNPSELLRNYCKLPIGTVYRVPQREEKIEAISSVTPYEPPPAWIDRVIAADGGLWILRVREDGAGNWARFGDRFLRRLKERSRENSWQLTLSRHSGVAVLQIWRTSDRSP